MQHTYHEYSYCGSFSSYRPNSAANFRDLYRLASGEFCLPICWATSRRHYVCFCGNTQHNSAWEVPCYSDSFQKQAYFGQSQDSHRNQPLRMLRSNGSTAGLSFEGARKRRSQLLQSNVAFHLFASCLWSLSRRSFYFPAVGYTNGRVYHHCVTLEEGGRFDWACTKWYSGTAEKPSTEKSTAG